MQITLANADALALAVCAYAYTAVVLGCRAKHKGTTSSREGSLGLHPLKTT